jgi:hypothetical protein
MGIDIREYTENFSKNFDKNSRFIGLKSYNLAKLLLIDPKKFNKKDLQRVGKNNILNILEIAGKSKLLVIEQNEENKYLCTITVYEEDNTKGKGPPKEEKSIASSIDLNPEDMILIQKFVNFSIDELLQL